MLHMDVVRDWLENVGGSSYHVSRYAIAFKSMFGSFARSEFLGISLKPATPDGQSHSVCNLGSVSLLQPWTSIVGQMNVACSCGEFVLVLTNGLKTNVP